jgi:hypothetical protein
MATTVWAKSEDFRRGSFYLRVSRRITQRRLPLRCQPQEAGSLSLAPDCLAPQVYVPITTHVKLKARLVEADLQRNIYTLDYLIGGAN